MRIDRRVDRTFTSCHCFGIDNIEELTQLSVDTNHRPHIESPEPFSLCDIVHGAWKNSRFFDECQPITRIDNPQQCLSWDERWKCGEWDLAYLLEKTLSIDKLCMSLHWSHPSNMIDTWTEMGDHVTSEVRTEEGLLFAVLTSNMISVFGVMNSCKNVLVHNSSQDSNRKMRRYSPHLRMTSVPWCIVWVHILSQNRVAPCFDGESNLVEMFKWIDWHTLFHLPRCNIPPTQACARTGRPLARSVHLVDLQELLLVRRVWLRLEVNLGRR